jgi:hypothetical protein
VNPIRTQKLDDNLRATIGLYRGLVLDACESELANQQQWTYLRSRLLKLLGDRGLEGKIFAILKDLEVTSEVL